ncbi:MAG: triose-phosphate isomerase, partial [Undibacterium sp.]|nr:triose-phosphate isomerase [Undibacterium sp.]
MRRTLIAGNWKMNGNKFANANLLGDLLAADLTANLAGSNCEMLVCVPSVYLAQCQSLLAGSVISLGAQDVSAHVSGAYTSEISASMLSDFSCQYVILGHSERRAYHQESDDLVAQKTLQALAAQICPIVCVGETLEQREAGKTEEVVLSQLQVVLDVLDAASLERIVIAYEPVWAIGTGKTATPAMAQEVHAVLRTCVAKRSVVAAEKMRILYGGSMKPDNAK